MPLRLEVIEGENLHKIFRVQDRENRIVGRSVHADITLNDPLISRKHCRLEVGEGSCLLIDLNSSNSTRLNGRKVRGSPLVTGDELRLGSHVLEATLETPDGEPIEPLFNLRYWLRRRTRVVVSILILVNALLIALLCFLYVNDQPGGAYGVRCPIAGCEPLDPEDSFFCNVHGVPLVRWCVRCGDEYSKNRSECPRCAGQTP